MDMFLAGFFLLNPEPTEEQVHTLAELVGIPAPDLEERVYALLSQMVEGDDEDGDEVLEDLDDEEVSSCAEDRLKQYASLIGSRGGTDD
jgi:predicted HAD superfamily phosphohydrolase